MYSKAAASASFCIGNQEIDQVQQFCYLGRPLAADDQDDIAISHNLAKARNTWGRLRPILAANGATPKIMARFYLAIVQAILLYGSETWVLSKRDLGRLEAFHKRCARNIAHRPITRQLDGTWIHPPTQEILQICHLSPIQTYIAKRKTTLLSRYACDSPLYRECRARIVSHISSSRNLLWWNAEPRIDSL